ncbi:MAG: metal-binding protein [Cellulosilyticum sp.]|nr:metal-binding protein [Cellulosilyticum sp.]
MTQAKRYKLLDENGIVYESEEKGQFGGHRKLKIYGTLDCPSANRYIAKGQYVNHRVFFKDEETAKAAGYRPCAKCMPEAYMEWKASNSYKR